MSDQTHDYGSGYSNGNGVPLAKTGSLSISPELFEKLYLSPQNAVKGDLRKTFGNPTPIAILGFAVGLSPLSVEFMGWRGATGTSATVGANIYFGGMLLTIAALLELFLGNTFPAVVFFAYGAHFFTFATTWIPFYNAVEAYDSSSTGKLTPAFEASFAFYAVFMGVLSFIFFICSLRTNLVFVLVFAFATSGFCFAAGSFWYDAAGNAYMGERLLVATGAAFFGASMLGWYLLAAIMLPSVDFPLSLPVFDLSNVVKGKAQRQQMA